MKTANFAGSCAGVCMNVIEAPRGSIVARELWAAFERSGAEIILYRGPLTLSAVPGVVNVGESGDSLVFAWAVEIAK